MGRLGEVRDAIEEGTTTAIVATGGVEESGVVAARSASSFVHTV